MTTCCEISNDTAKEEILASLTELDRLGYTGGPDKWVRRIPILELAVTVDRTPKGWVVKLHAIGFELSNDGEIALDEHGQRVEHWMERKAHYFKTMCGVVAQARIYTGLTTI